MTLLTWPRYSYRENTDIPGFDDSGPRTVMDAHCSLCSQGAKWIAKNDKKQEFKIIPLQSDLGRALISHHGMDPDDPMSWLYIVDGHAYSSLDAFIRVATRIGGIWNTVGILKLIPSNIQNWMYGIVARNRYRIGGKTDLCSMPDLKVQKRLIK